MSDKVLFADSEVSVHQPYGSPFKDHFGSEKVNVHSVTLLPGQYVDLDSLPKYEQDKATGSGIAGARVLERSEAELLESSAVASRDAEVEGVDNSHSDYMVTDEDRAANHAALADVVSGAGEVESSLVDGDNAFDQPYLQSKIESPVDAVENSKKKKVEPVVEEVTVQEEIE